MPTLYFSIIFKWSSLVLLSVGGFASQLIILSLVEPNIYNSFIQVLLIASFFHVIDGTISAKKFNYMNHFILNGNEAEYKRTVKKMLVDCFFIYLITCFCFIIFFENVVFFLNENFAYEYIYIFKLLFISMAFQSFYLILSQVLIVNNRMVYVDFITFLKGIILIIGILMAYQDSEINIIFYAMIIGNTLSLILLSFLFVFVNYFSREKTPLIKKNINQIIGLNNNYLSPFFLYFTQILPPLITNFYGTRLLGQLELSQINFIIRLLDVIGQVFRKPIEALQVEISRIKNRSNKERLKKIMNLVDYIYPISIILIFTLLNFLIERIVIIDLNFVFLATLIISLMLIFNPKSHLMFLNLVYQDNFYKLANISALIVVIQIIFEGFFMYLIGIKGFILIKFICIYSFYMLLIKTKENLNSSIIGFFKINFYQFVFLFILLFFGAYFHA